MNYIIDEKENRDDLFFKELGIVLELSDGIVTISGLYDVSFGEMIDIIIPGSNKPIIGIILNIEYFKVMPNVDHMSLYNSSINVKINGILLKENMPKKSYSSN